MPIAMHHEGDDTYRLDISGVLGGAEFRQCEAELARELERGGSAKLLCVLNQFEGWDPHSDWNQFGFYVRHGGAITRIAIVGDERWRDLTMMFASADLRRAPVEFFPERDLARARAWLDA